ncbi:hypothetical protein AVEN_14102-1 [Araneus ventricosus]|uniref:BTB domain-containing protein n=1 Tax=Araneus ventricosus TaxID=182803 RepID=A0A4Y2JML2_ARAVE|nr:hypothetical protein AVEN_14102-1 [Araneus ventricosus]
MFSLLIVNTLDLLKLLYLNFFACGSISSKLTNEVVENRNEHYAGKEKSQNISDMVGNLKYMDIDAILCDTELCTSTHTFTAHKIILTLYRPAVDYSTFAPQRLPTGRRLIDF